MKKIKFYVRQIRTDPTPYKVYAPELEPAKKLVISLSVPDEAVIEETEETIEISPKTFLTLLRKWSSLINSIYQDVEE